MPTNTQIENARAARRQYDDDTVQFTRRAQKLRGGTNLVAPVTVERVREAINGLDPLEAIAPMGVERAKRFARGDRSVKVPDEVRERYSAIEDPFARSRGFVAVCLALAKK